MIIGIDASRCFGAEKTGTEKYAYEVVRHILEMPEAKGHEWVLYVKTSPSIPLLISGEGRNIRYVQVPLPYLWTQVGLAWRTWVDKLDVLWVPAHTLPLLSNPSVKTVVTVHGLEYEWLPSFKNLFQRYYLPLSTTFVAKRASRLIAVSEFTKGELVQRLGVEGKKIKVIYEGVSTSPLRPSPKLLGLAARRGNEGEVLRKYGLEPKQYILTVGTVQPRKNLRRLVQAFAQLTPNPSLYQREGNGRSELKLVIVGKLGWEYEADLKAPEEFGVVGKVKFLNYVSDEEKMVLLQNAVVYVQASITEGFGLPVIEAMAAGVPVVSSNGGALREILKIPNPKSSLGFARDKQIPNKSQIQKNNDQNYAGLLFNPLDVDDMCHSLALVIRSHSLRTELMKKGEERAAEFTWEKTARETYNKLVNSD